MIYDKNYIKKYLIIRLEEKKDWHKVETLTKKAFWRDERIEKIGVGAVEHYMVREMRGKDGIDNLTFVAELNNQIVGHIIYTKNSYILQPDGLKKEVLNFGPLSILPKYQKLGVGNALMTHSIKRAKELGYGAILFFGHATYYPKFGFKEAKEYNITTSDEANFPEFMAMELQEGYLKGVSGRFIEPPIYNENITKKTAKEYDERTFKEKI